MLVWDNQQATGWFVGILEGEGSFYRIGNTYSISIPNNDEDIIETCEKYLSYNNINFTTYKCKNGTKIGYKTCVYGLSCKELYKIIEQHLQCRRNEFQRILGASTTERDLSIDLYWLIGIIEAEGCIFLSKNYRNNLTPRIELDNTNPKIILKLVKNLQQLGLSWYAKQYQRGTNKPFTKITIQGVLRCRRFLTATKNLWRCNKNLKKTKLLLDYCEYRLSRTVNSEFNAVDFEYYNQLKQLNG